MSQKKIVDRFEWTVSEIRETMPRYAAGEPIEDIANDLGRTVDGVRQKMAKEGVRWGSGRKEKRSGFKRTTEIPTPNRSLDEIMADQAERYAAKTARYGVKHNGIHISIDEPGPYGILFFGDPHADDDGCDLERLAYDMRLVQDTEHLYGACIGDLTNNWIRVLGHLYAHQHTTDDEAAELLKWVISSVDWMFIVLGNHDVWSSLAKTVCDERGVTHVSHGAMFIVDCDNHSLTVDARHTHKGNSMYNPAHAQLKRNHRGSNADIIVAGHTHQSAYTMLKNGVTGKIGHAIRVGAYKKADEYADMLGLDDECISPSVLCVVNPDAKEEGIVSVFHDVESGVVYLNALRSQYANS